MAGLKDDGAKTSLGGLNIMSNKIDSEGHQHIETDRARAGSTPGMTRYILGISLVLVIVLFAAIYLFT